MKRAAVSDDVGWFSQVSEVIARDEYRYEASGSEAWSAPNRGQELRSRVGLDGIEVYPRNRQSDGDDSAWTLHLETTLLGRPGAMRSFASCIGSLDGQRVELDHGALVEWYMNNERGIEQGWKITERPAGVGFLVIGVESELVLRVEPGGRSGVFIDSSGEERLGYRDLLVWDAEQRELPAWLVSSATGFEVHVDDTGAVYPVVVDPVITGAAWSVESNQAFAAFGFVVGSAGDVNGDGFGDVIVGAFEYDNGETDEGRAYLYLGSPGGLSTSAAWTAESNQAGGEFGFSVASAGDVNGDGYGDVIVGANTYNGGGRTYVYHGSALGLSTSAAWVTDSSQVGAHYGQSVAGVGDVNGDGFGDVLVGADRHSNGQTREGCAYVYHGSASGLSTIAAWTAEANQSFSSFGVSVSGAGDVNGDGFADIIVGGDGYSGGQANEGRAWVYLGSASGLSPSASWTAEPNQAGASFGLSVSGAGDVNGDGFADVIVGAYEYTNGEVDEGRVFVYHGSAGGLSASAAWTAESNQAGAAFGVAVAGAGDVNSDGFDDVIIGSTGFDQDQSNEGLVFVYHGGAAGLGATESWSEESNQLGAELGSSVAGAGDVNGDGHADVIVGAWAFDNGQIDEGGAFAYLGSGAGLGFTAAGVQWRNGGSNPDSFVAGPPVLGQTWNLTVDLTTTGHLFAQVFGFSLGGVSIPFPAGQTLLVAGANTLKLPLRAGPLASWAVSIPSSVALCGTTAFAQAVHVVGVKPFALSNAQDLVIGF